MNYEEYKEIIEREASALNHKECVALCLVCCARLSPLYSKFVSTENWGDELTLSQARKAASEWLSGKSIDTRPISQKLLLVIPDTEDFGSALGSYALNAGVAHEHLLEQIRNSSPSQLICVLLNCYDTADFYAQEALDPHCLGNIEESGIENHEAVVKEISFQCGILKEVKRSASVTEFVGSFGNEPIFKIA